MEAPGEVESFTSRMQKPRRSPLLLQWEAWPSIVRQELDGVLLLQDIFLNIELGLYLIAFIHPDVVN